MREFPVEIAIHKVAQTNAGTPVAFAMFTASVDAPGAKGDERKSTVFRSSKAFKTHCTARKLTKNVANLGRAKRATATNPAESNTPAAKVKGIPAIGPPDQIGINKP